MKYESQISDQLNLDFPLIMAPMFLVTNLQMMTEGMRSGIGVCFPSLNFRRPGELEQVLIELAKAKAGLQKGNYGVNLIVQKTNPVYERHLQVCVEHKVPFYVTSLGNPRKVVEAAHGYGAKVYCDVTNLTHARKASDAGCDGFIAISKEAGGHAGNLPIHSLIAGLKHAFPGKPILAAGGIANGRTIASALESGADAAYIGTRFIASAEAPVSDAYKEAIVNADAEDIVMTERLSGTPCAIINTPYAKKIGYRQTFFERLLSRNRFTKKYFKMLVQLRGLKMLEKAVKPGNYDNLWTAGKSVAFIHDIIPVRAIIERLKAETEKAILS